MCKWSHDAYNEYWATFGRSYPLLIVLIRGGLEIYVRKVSYIALFFSWIPMLTVMVVVGIVAALAVGFPWVLGMMSGLMLNGISPTVIVILMLTMISTGQGKARGIP